jgi:hypothetical protein
MRKTRFVTIILSLFIVFAGFAKMAESNAAAFDTAVSGSIFKYYCEFSNLAVKMMDNILNDSLIKPQKSATGKPSNRPTPKSETERNESLGVFMPSGVKTFTNENSPFVPVRGDSVSVRSFNFKALEQSGVSWWVTFLILLFIMTVRKKDTASLTKTILKIKCPAQIFGLGIFAFYNYKKINKRSLTGEVCF